MPVETEGSAMQVGCRLVLLVFAVAVSDRAFAQALSPEFVHGVDYSFERMEATRTVNDADDRGAIRLVTLVYRPIKGDKREVVLFSHGSTGGEIKSPKEPWEGPPQSVVRFFVSRGYTVVAPMRRGRAESSGTYIEECAIYAGECTLARQTAMMERSVREAMLDTTAVIDQVVLGRLMPRESKLLLAGVSRGGYLSLMVASERAQQVKGVVNFVGGWLSVSAKYPQADNDRRLEAQSGPLTQAGKRSTAPSVWIYAARDPLYDEATTRELFRAYREGGGRGEYVFVRDHSLPSGHNVASALPLWEAAVEGFLKGLDMRSSHAK
jgi:pimeloyl-ACP methyl ester carboxylesterase